MNIISPKIYIDTKGINISGFLWTVPESIIYKWKPALSSGRLKDTG